MGWLPEPTLDGVRDVGRWEVLLAVADSTIDRFGATADKTVENTVTETSLLGVGQGTLTFPADFFTAGSVVRITMRGELSDTGTPDFTLRLKFGSTVIADVGPTALTGVSSVEWMLDALITCRAAGASGTFIGGGLFDYDDGTELALDSDTDVTVDTTGELTLDVTWEWGTANASNTVTCRASTISLHNPNRIAVGGLEPVLTPDETDWVYGWVAD